MLLTIAVLTYNRGYLLDQFFEKLHTLLIHHPNKVEVLVSNNSSTDDTDIICNKWTSAFEKIADFSYVKQKLNIGLSKNIVYLFENAKSDYLILLPDDDELVSDNFHEILNILENHRPSALIQNIWNGEKVIGKCGVVSYQEATNLFYVYGNAWAAIIDTKKAVAAVRNRGLNDEIELIVWPQTVMGFLAMHDAKENILTVDFEIGKNSAGCQNLTNKKYWSVSFYGLLKAASIVDSFTNNNLARKAFFTFRNRGFKSHLASILFYSVVAENYSTLQLRQLLRADYGFLGWIFSMLLWVSDKFPATIAFLGALAYTIVLRKSPLKYLQLIRENKKLHASQVKDIKSNNMRFGDWF